MLVDMLFINLLQMFGDNEDNVFMHRYFFYLTTYQNVDCY